MSSTESGRYTKIYYEREDGRRIPMEEKITGGKIGAALDLRGRNYEPDNDNLVMERSKIH